MILVAVLVGLALLVGQVAMGSIAAVTPEDVAFHLTVTELVGFVAFVLLVGPTLLFVGRFTARVTVVETQQTKTLDEMREMFDAHRRDVDRLWKAHNECRTQFQDAILAIKLQGCGRADCPAKERENRR